MCATFMAWSWTAYRYIYACYIYIYTYVYPAGQFGDAIEHYSKAMEQLDATPLLRGAPPTAPHTQASQAHRDLSLAPYVFMV